MAGDARPYDGTLEAWADVEPRCDWDALLLGNGLSINVWPWFKYESLYAFAVSEDVVSAEQQRLFETLGTTNFEEVLQKLADAIVVGEALGRSCEEELALHSQLRDALGRAVQNVHVMGVPQQTLEAIRAELRAHRHVFSTSYDLLIYWASAAGPEPFEGALDFFWAGGINAFDARTIHLAADDERTRFHYLHGALHLVVLTDGTTCKHTSAHVNLLEKFGSPFRGDATARPLIVTEASAAEKRRRIAENDYLTYCLDALAGCDAPLVVFGQSLGEQDRHLVDAINEHPQRAVAFALLDRGPDVNVAEKHRVAGLLPNAELHFFDAATHRLGDPGLRVADA